MPVIWELDFYSRPLVDDQNKKLWEVLICESPLEVTRDLDSLFRYSEFVSGTEVNSVRLQKALQAAIAQAPQPPDKIRFFRRQMTNMITKACNDAGIPVYASRRTLALAQWLQHRLEEVYPSYPNYQAGSNPTVNLMNPAPQRLPDALLGQTWAFVSLPAEAFADMPEWPIDFGEAFPLSLVNLPPKTLIPGLIIFSPRALPIAGWLGGLELACVKYLDSPPQLLIETGANDAWILANLSTEALRREAEQFEAAKQKANHVHFIAVQTDANSEAFTGFWLLHELNLA